MFMNNITHSINNSDAQLCEVTEGAGQKDETSFKLQSLNEEKKIGDRSILL